MHALSGSNILVATKKDFEPGKPKTVLFPVLRQGDYDAVIIGHTQFEKILFMGTSDCHAGRSDCRYPFSIEEATHQAGQNYTIKRLEKQKKSHLHRRGQKKLNDQTRKDDVVTHAAGCRPRLFVDKSHSLNLFYIYKNQECGRNLTDGCRKVRICL